jgi:ferritin-like metal-binding protein YciE
MTDKRSELADWLRDAHAMEKNLAEMLEGQVERLAHFPRFQQAVASHAQETRRHAGLIEGALRSIGEDTSALKDRAAQIAGLIGAFTGGMACDAPVKFILSNYAAEHFEIACYQALVAAAESAGYPEVVSVCREILRDEQAAAGVLADLIPDVTRVHLGNL